MEAAIVILLVIELISTVVLIYYVVKFNKLLDSLARTLELVVGEVSADNDNKNEVIDNLSSNVEGSNVESSKADEITTSKSPSKKSKTKETGSNKETGTNSKKIILVAFIISAAAAAIYHLRDTKSETEANLESVVQKAASVAKTATDASSCLTMAFSTPITKCNGDSTCINSIISSASGICMLDLYKSNPAAFKQLCEDIGNKKFPELYCKNDVAKNACITLGLENKIKLQYCREKK